MSDLSDKLIQIKKFMSSPSPVKDTRLERAIKIAALSTDSSPSDEQKRSGNYRKGRFKMRGMTFVIENPRGSIRSGSSPDGAWSVVMTDHYGYILKTKSEADGDHLDVYIGPNPLSRKVFAIDQKDFRTGEFDEHKFMVGFSSKEAARQSYEDAFSGNSPFAGMVELSWDEFKGWIDFGNSSVPIVDQMLREFNSRVELLKSEEGEDGSVYLYGACMVPNLVDRSRFRDYYTEEDVRKAAYGYMQKSQKAGHHHKAVYLNKDVQLVESFLTPQQMNINGKELPKGSWIVKFRLNHPEAIRMAKAGEYAAFSIGGPSKKWRLERRNGEASPWFGPNGDK
jgi:hypothetical protein